MAPRMAAHPQHGSGARVQSNEAPAHGSGAELRTTAVNNGAQARKNNDHGTLDQEHHLLHERCEEHESARVLGGWVDRQARGEEH